MDLNNLPLGQLREAPWNPNQMDEPMLGKLRESIRRFGLLEPLVVRPLEDGAYEVIDGNQTLRILTELAFESAPCVVINLDDTQAQLLSQALNHIRGEEDLGLRAELLKSILASIPQEEVLKLLPESPRSLAALTSIGQDTIADYLRNWQKAQAAKLRHMVFQLTSSQLEVVEEALARIMPRAKERPGDNPNLRGTALYFLCKAYLKVKGGSHD